MLDLLSKNSFSGPVPTYPDAAAHKTAEGRAQIKKNKDAVPKHELGWLFTGQKQKPNIFM